MSTAITTIPNEITTTPEVIHSGDAAAVVIYASELLELWNLHLDKPLRAASPLFAARFETLIVELRCAAVRTERKISRLVSERQGGEA
ncbi:hypothetical protein [Klebsiella quasipneumoniae]|uniref:Uncharacterized protein n=1 Tax=Klebsiella quasipneumoniae TaxID=1463165 RepID=A0A8I0DGI1_9ENTR|nr:hypothetical protein [Klebsiella quasipneumoniae]ELC0921272.1 hypothetical protein [Klebsiella quasipneumoniae]MBC5047827.1 hypothetical protein [Klebsiella quasipneumoniae]MDF3331187.1 hypothetical protein [Klebsiella quasipneumoniae subsp. similipneumoniae]TNC60108.1 hypothetical protein FHB93_22630 [Klebsiella quasipneumoniae]TNK06248.1 hypothetical protein CI664_001385 [Klebsiella quasipneumoniae subsp. similipneumoniae]